MKSKEGLWRLSPSGLYSFEECEACFWIENHHEKAPGIPPVLNMAMDSIFKSRYDTYREKNELPPEIQELGEKGVSLFGDLETLNKWRGHSSHLRIINEKIGYMLSGKLDEVLVEKDGRLIPTDFKSSGYAPKEDKQKYYVSQLNAYASLNVEFVSHIDPVKIDLGALEKKITEMVKLLNGPYPGDDLECGKCVYFKKRGAIKS